VARKLDWKPQQYYPPSLRSTGLSAGEHTVLFSGPGAKALAAASSGIPIFKTFIWWYYGSN